MDYYEECCRDGLKVKNIKQDRVDKDGSQYLIVSFEGEVNIPEESDEGDFHLYNPRVTLILLPDDEEYDTNVMIDEIEGEVFIEYFNDDGVLYNIYDSNARTYAIEEFVSDKTEESLINIAIEVIAMHIGDLEQDARTYGDWEESSYYWFDKIKLSSIKLDTIKLDRKK